MDLERDHWPGGDSDPGGPPPGAALPPGSGSVHPNAVAPPGTQGNQMFGANPQAADSQVQQRPSNGAAQGQVPPGSGIGGNSPMSPHIRQNGTAPGAQLSSDPSTSNNNNSSSNNNSSNNNSSSRFETFFLSN